MTSRNNTKQTAPSPKPSKRTKKIEAKAPVEPSNEDRGLIVVGIGASAGGLEALQAFFGALPADTGMAFVVITHLHPEHESHMAELLQRHTAMPAIQVNKKVKIKPDHVYVIPPNRSMLMTDTHLATREYAEAHDRHTPIDRFFRSMASSGHSDPVAIILSGGGTDGAVGVKDVKEVGGVIMVQEPDDAEYDSMPRAALSTGLVDVVLPAAALAEKLADYMNHRPKLPHDPGQLSEADTETLQRILAQVHARTGHDFSQYKQSTILRRVERRMQLNGFVTLDAYLAYMRGNSGEAQAMFNDILIGVTNVFRDHDSWLALQEQVIPELIRKSESKAEEGIRVWSIGCATGEEAYGLAMMLFEEADRQAVHVHIQIFASDLDDRSIAQAREGLYPAAIEADVSPERLERFFTREGEYYRVKREVRDVVLFTGHNVLRDPPFSRQDLIVCRNVLIYLDRNVQDQVFDIFHYALNPGGYLFLGSSESGEHLPGLFGVLDKAHRIYQARPWSGEKPHVPSLPLIVKPGSRRASIPSIDFRLNRQRLTDESLLLEEQHQRALETYGPPSVIVNERYAILHVSENAGRYLHQPKGPITGDLLTLIRPELQLELRAALFHAFEKSKATVSRPVNVQFNGHKRPVILSVRPRPESTTTNKGAERQALVLFIEDEAIPDVLEGEAEPTTAQPEQSMLTAQLQAEIQRLREQLQITIEEYDSSNEEMKASNEELQSINEEYRSATEELETSKEELQSVNEELQTVNNDIKNKLEEISSAHQELENLLGATEIGVLFLDRQLRIQRFTAGVSNVFNIMPTDRGRPIRHLTHKMNYNQLTEDAEQVLRKLVPVEREAQTENGDWYLLRLRPYRTTEDKIQGVVISFVDISNLKKTELQLSDAKNTLEEHVAERTQELALATEQIRQARDMFYTLFHSNPIPTSLTRLDDGTFLNVNDAYLDFADLSREQVLGKTAQELGLPILPNIRPSISARVQSEGMVRDLELQVQRGSGEKAIVLASIQLVNIDGVQALLLSFIDITQRVKAEQQIRSLASDLTIAEQEERRRISQILHDDLQQRIFAVKMQLSTLYDAYQNNNFSSAHIDFAQLEEWLDESIAMTRNLSIDLSPAVLKGDGLADALVWLASQMREQYGLDVRVQTDNVSTRFEDTLRILLFQAVREALFNVVKHANTLQAQISFEELDGHIRITVSDEGNGFYPQESTHDGGGGLRNLRDRLNLMGCRLKIYSQPGAGTHMIIDIPQKRQIIE
jgi:two-component system CheB/CheR fusion protein